MRGAGVARVGRPGMSSEQKKELWRRWREGQSLSEIGRALGKVPGSVHHVVAARGGIAPVSRCRSRLALGSAEREEISRGVAVGASVRVIAARLGRAPSTVSREVGRNGGREAYRAQSADAAAWHRTLRPKRCRLAQRPRVAGLVAGKLAEDWSPPQIAGWLRATYPDDGSMRVSHETIYLSLFVQARGVLRKELTAHLRTRRTTRRVKTASTAGQSRGQIRDAVSIRDRPAQASDRAVPGHWEGDLIAGSHNSWIATLVERRSRYLVLVRVAGKDTTSVVSALTHHVKTLPTGLMNSLTWDRGTELATHHHFTMSTDVAVYFCDPHSPWQRGSNENTNGLLRQYFPKGHDLSGYTQRHLDTIAAKLNTRPRKTLGYATPAATIAENVAPTP